MLRIHNVVGVIFFVIVSCGNVFSMHHDVVAVESKEVSSDHGNTSIKKDKKICEKR